MHIEGLYKLLQRLNYRVLINPKIRLGGKFPDIIGVTNREILAVEVKGHITEITQAIGQCLFYINDSTKVFVAIPKHELSLVSKDTLEVLKNYGIGLIGYGEKSEIFLEAKKFSNAKAEILEEVEKNFIPGKQKITPRNIAKIIENLLKEHPEGLTIVDLAKISGINRITISKYLFGLFAQKKVKQRKVGIAKLNFLR